MDYSGDVVKVSSSNGSQWTAQKVKPAQTSVAQKVRVALNVLLLPPPGSRYGPANVASEERCSLQPSAPREEAEGDPQPGSRDHRKGISGGRG